MLRQGLRAASALRNSFRGRRSMVGNRMRRIGINIGNRLNSLRRRSNQNQRMPTVMNPASRRRTSGLSRGAKRGLAGADGMYGGIEANRFRMRRKQRRNPHRRVRI